MNLKTAFQSLDDQSKQELANFCGTSVRTVRNWGTECVPKGLYLIKAIVFMVVKKDLNIDGYENEQRYFKAMVILGFKLLTAEELADLLKFKEACDAYDFMINRHGLSSEREISLSKLFHSLDSQLKAILDKNGTINDTENLTEDFAVLLEVLTKMEPGLDFLLTASSNARRKFRENLEEKGITVFKTSNALYRVSAKFNSLCSEKNLNEKQKSTTK